MARWSTPDHLVPRFERGEEARVPVALGRREPVEDDERRAGAAALEGEGPPPDRARGHAVEANASCGRFFFFFFFFTHAPVHPARS